MRDVDRRATWAPGGVPWAGPPAKSIVATLPHVPQLDDDVREFVHQRAEDADIKALTSDEAPTGYAIHLDLHDDGTWTYDEDTVLMIKDQSEPFHHRDKSTLSKIGEPTPNPLARH